MNTLTLDFDLLYVLESPAITLIEIQRKDLEEYAPLHAKFQWLLIDHTTLAIQQLTFRSMDASSDVEERFFEEGFLKFNNESGTYIAKFNSAQHPLLRKIPMVLSPALQLAVTNYLNRR